MLKAWIYWNWIGNNTIPCESCHRFLSALSWHSRLDFWGGNSSEPFSPYDMRRNSLKQAMTRFWGDYNHQCNCLAARESLIVESECHCTECHQYVCGSECDQFNSFLKGDHSRVLVIPNTNERSRAQSNTAELHFRRTLSFSRAVVSLPLETPW
jgi:hypothetical protein